jgi:hypothetical protein
MPSAAGTGDDRGSQEGGTGLPVPEAADAASVSTVDIRTVHVWPDRVHGDDAGYRAVGERQFATILGIAPVRAATGRQMTGDEYTTANGTSRRTVLAAGVIGAAGLVGRPPCWVGDSPAGRPTDPDAPHR